MKPVLGIDFGTSNTSAAWVDRGGLVRVVDVREGVAVLPSVVCFHKNGSVLVGQSAKELLGDDPKNTVFGVKRFLGRRFLSDYVGRHRAQFVFNLVEGPSGLTAVELYGKVRPLEDVAFEVLKRIVELANIAADDTFEECILAAPAHFSYRQRQVLRRTAERLLKVTKMVNEPTAAAVYFAKDAQAEETVLVYDLGGGTFDVTLLRLKRGLVEVLATGGDAFLGGSDFDARLTDLLRRELEDKHDLDLALDMVVSQRLLAAAERAKIALSTDEDVKLRVPCVTIKDDRFIDLETRVTRQKLEELCAPLIERTLGVAEAVVASAGLTPKDVDELVLVGGQTRMPALRTRLAQRFTLRADRQMSPELGVAIGAALLGRGIHVLVDVLSVPVGIMIPSVGPKEAAPRNIALPCVRRVPIPVRPPPGQSLNLVVYEAVDLTSIDRDVLGTLPIPAAWLDQNAGDLALEVRMSASFELAAFVHAKEGGRLELKLQPIEKPGPAPAGRAPLPVDGVVRQTPRVSTALKVALRVEGTNDPPASFETTNASKGGMYIRSPRPLSLGTRVEVELQDLPRRPWVQADVVHSVDAETARAIGQHPGMGLKLVEVAEDVAAALARHLEGRGEDEEVLLLTEVVDDEVVVEGRLLPDAEVAPAVLLRRFLAGMAKNRVYDALGTHAFASFDEVRAALERAAAAFTAAEAAAGQDPSDDSVVRPQVRLARNILERCRGMLLDPRQRLEYDFKIGEVHAEQRLAHAEAGGVGTELLREAWLRVHPGNADRAAIHFAYALKSARTGELQHAVDAGQEALRLDPFDVEIRDAVEAWEAAAPA